METFIDTHAHLNSKQFDEDLGRVITSSKKAGVKKIIVPGFDIPTSMKSISMARKYPGVIFATCGIHPYHANKVADLYKVRETFIELIKRGDVVAIGEVGLDYHLYKNEEASGKKQQQKELLQMEIEIALEFRLPMILHCRNAWDDYLDLLGRYKDQGLKGVSHCFEGGTFYLRQLIGMGLYIGCNGLITFNSRLPQVVQEIPLDYLLLETDSPFLTPVPFRGKRNEPKFVRHVASFIAEIKKTSVGEIARKTNRNAVSLFKLN